jgi:hypothetical protein
MLDARVEILARLVGIAAEVPGVATAGRNRIDLSETARPAIIALDADETAEEEEECASRLGHAPQIVVICPTSLCSLASHSADADGWADPRLDRPERLSLLCRLR